MSLRLQGPIGRGVPTILEMVVHTRLDCALGSAGLMRVALRNTAYYCSQRKAFGMTLHQAPAMTALLVDLAAESEAAVWMSLHMAATFDRCLQAPDNVSEQAFRRLAVAVTKYFVCKQTPGVVNEALEGIGGNGYVEEWDFPRWFRQSPLNSVWEGSGNVIALDIQRTLAKEPLALSSFFEHLSTTSGLNVDLDAYVKDLHGFVKQGAAVDPHNARYFAETCALALQGHCLINAAKQTGSESVDATARYWCATRLKPAACRLYGSRLASDPKVAAAILDRLIAPLA
jgi:putative acyl-CoA dehydrogenase